MKAIDNIKLQIGATNRDLKILFVSLFLWRWLCNLCCGELVLLQSGLV